ncbi:hypothetical protein [Streptoalloteichus tenebrarius]|uniref:hypothetical protein n=1 Tax=Streptoalloteichus tenebrarius (strain ATCC 17920 / DSM 40477 / JCM 4838 / CBS 697.72 / NBRC 16177 / NCIMB 11028 / NRRL B-12390 / A12253. 1 / ISP 5477) TaxID=1933 RepID=UPI0020A5FBE8|nr:hypothetical protein [Streptoalloteichus tenebrarius]BFF00679.1 hypothetical protein GCM10020241_23540 [Streptoalloteichus tenebrarius]
MNTEPEGRPAEDERSPLEKLKEKAKKVVDPGVPTPGRDNAETFAPAPPTEERPRPDEGRDQR